MVANYLLDIVFLLTAAVIAVPAFRALGLGVVPGFLVAGILARGHGARQCRELQRLGAGFTVAENMEASLDLAREVLRRESDDIGDAEALLQRFRREYYGHIDTEADEEKGTRP